MKTLFQTATRDEVLQRFERLTPHHTARWGRMDAPRMVKHMLQSMRMASGELRCKPRNTPLRHTPLKQLIIYWIPFPKGVPTAPELLSGEPGEWAADLTSLRQLVNSFRERGQTGEWPEHPAFGRLTPKLWGVLTYRHMDHHLRQFGV